MTHNQMRRRRRRRAAAVDRCLRRYYRQVAIEEELAALLPRPDSLREAGNAGRGPCRGDDEMAYLIDSDEARHIAEVPDEIGFCYGKAIPEDESQAWVNATALKGLRSLGRDPRIIAEEPTLPTFHGLASAIDTAEYGEELTVEALAFDPEAVGVVYVGWGCERDIALQLMEWRDRFFYYSLKESRPYLWLVLSDPTGQYDETGRDVARWAYTVLYDRDENFKGWLEGLGFDLSEALAEVQQGIEAGEPRVGR